MGNVPNVTDAGVAMVPGDSVFRLLGDVVFRVASLCQEANGMGVVSIRTLPKLWLRPDRKHIPHLPRMRPRDRGGGKGRVILKARFRLQTYLQ